jgi:hypothetical protein
VVNKIAIASDHAGFELKQLLIESLSSDLEIEDFGTDSLEPCDFPDYATKVSDFVFDPDYPKQNQILSLHNLENHKVPNYQFQSPQFQDQKIKILLVIVLIQNLHDQRQ